jgi:WD40 repeat protein
VDGELLPAYAERMRLPRAERIELVARVCDAVAHAHDQGVVHRDLKPSNVMVKADGQPKVLDFGVALIVREGVDVPSRHTRVGELIGTLPYMSPEQLGGDPARIDGRADVYALGVIAYELLAGRLPHDVGGLPVPAAARIVSERSPTRLGSLDRTLRGDLDTIVGKALEKEAARRYASARELATDFRRFLRHEPVRAVPPSNFYYLRRFARRNPALSSSLALAGVLLIAGTAVSTCQARRADQLRALADEEARIAHRAAQASTLAAARVATEHADFTTSRRLLDSIAPADRGWVWKWLKARDDGRIASFTTAATARAAAFAADSNAILAIDELGALSRWTPGDDAARRELQLGVQLTGPAAFDRNARFLAGVHGSRMETLSVWDAASARTIADVAIAGARPTLLAVSPGGRSVACGGTGALLWDTARREAAPILGATCTPAALEFSRDGRRLACSYNPLNDWPGWFALVDVATGQSLGTPWQLASDQTMGVALSPDGRAAVAFRNKRAYVVDPDRREVAAELTGNEGPVRCVAFDRDGGRAATGSESGGVRVFDAKSGRVLAVLSGAHEPVRQVAFDAGGSRILALSGNETSLWELGSDPDVLRANASYVYDVAFLRGGKRLVSLSFDGELCVWDAASLALLRKVHRPGAPGTTYGIAVARDGDTLAVTCGREVAILDGDSLQPLRKLALDWPAEVRRMSLSPDGRALAATTGAGLAVWDVQSGELRVRGSFGLATYYPAIVFSHDGRRFAISEGNQAVVRDAASGNVIARLEGHAAPVEALAFAPDDSSLASGSVDRTVRVWDARTWSTPTVLQGHADRVYSLAFAPDGAMLASGSNDATIRLWSVASGDELALLTGHEDYVFALAFDPDGSRLVSASGDKTLRIWDTLPRSARWRAGQVAEARRDAVRSRMKDALSAAADLAAAVRRLRDDATLAGGEREACIQAVLELAPGNER